MSDPIEYLDLDDLIELAMLMFGEPAPIRDVGLLNSAASRPRTVAFGMQAYEGVWAKAAALLDSVVTNKALDHGNKILGWLATAVFLELNGVKVDSVDNASVIELVNSVTARKPAVKTIAKRLENMVA